MVFRPPLTDEQRQQAIDLYNSGETKADICRVMGISPKTAYNIIKDATKRGLTYSIKTTVPEGFMVSRITDQVDADGVLQRQSVQMKPETGGQFNIPEGHQIKGVSALVDADGNVIQQWFKTKEGTNPVAAADLIKQAFDEMKFRVPVINGPDFCNDNCLTLFNLPDLHMGLYAWGEETDENWDLKKADACYRKAFSNLVAMTPRNGTAVILAGGDQMHADNPQNRTEHSGNHLDVDGRYDRVLLKTCELFVWFTALALQTHEKVIVRVLKGNHDPNSSVAIAFFLLASFRDNPRVTVDISPSLFWMMQFGKVMLVSTHGHMAKPEKIPGIMAARWPKVWGDTVFRYAHTNHIHHRTKYVNEDGGAIVETHQSPSAQDGWHYAKGFISGRSFRSIVYHQDRGEIGGFVEPILPNPPQEQ